ncbi:neuropeptide FF receptor 1-like isoform X1 [Monodelphis domestica]|nr:neuropeptide FF receptor 1-like isoform X1 [Monodelphis domestica]XP_056662462.1 neuropeptide FF receptor 1-like isoform X1 [Monodelphis domestica]XP_056662463.1 neuropeptide FF receptor 1-like isoform X1 [Monodelphis domestica]
MDTTYFTSSANGENTTLQAMASNHSLGELSWEELEKLLFFFAKEPVAISLTALYLLSFSVGLAGNTASLWVLLAGERRRAGRSGTAREGPSPTRRLLANLAVCDLLVVCICMPLTVGNVLYKAWVFGDFLCRAAPFVQALTVAASALSLTAISLHRYYGVRRPLRARASCTRGRALATILSVWAVSAAICLPLAFANRRDEIELVEGLPLAFPICREVWPGARLKQAYSCLLFGLLYCLPVLFNLALGWLTVKRLQDPPGPWARGSQEGEGPWPMLPALPASRLKVRQRVAHMVMALVALFAVTWLPIYLLDIWIDFHTPDWSHGKPTTAWVLQLRPFAQWLGLTNSSLNPLCYCFVGSLARTARQVRRRYRQRLSSLFRPSITEGTPLREGGTETEGRDEGVSVQEASSKSKEKVPFGHFPPLSKPLD